MKFKLHLLGWEHFLVSFGNILKDRPNVFLIQEGDVKPDFSWLNLVLLGDTGVVAQNAKPDFLG